MYERQPLEHWHLKAIALRDQMDMKDLDRFIEMGAEFEHGWAGLKDGEILVCGAINILWPGRASTWVLLSDAVGPSEMLWVHRQVARSIDEAQRVAGFWRLEATTVHGFHQGIRWLKMLGFELEGFAEQYGPDGRAHFLMARLWPQAELALIDDNCSLSVR